MRAVRLLLSDINGLHLWTAPSARLTDGLHWRVRILFDSRLRERQMRIYDNGIETCLFNSALE
jgi:hypothetical protein